VLEDILLPDAQPGEQINNGPNIVVMNYMFTQDWQPDPVFLIHMERKKECSIRQDLGKLFCSCW
jgi:hypothetical protein